MAKYRRKGDPREQRVILLPGKKPKKARTLTPEFRLSSIQAWVGSGPGIYKGSVAVNPYAMAFRDLCKFTKRECIEGPLQIDQFERDLDSLGYRAGIITFKGKAIVLLLLPSNLDVALDRLIALEAKAV